MFARLVAPDFYGMAKRRNAPNGKGTYVMRLFWAYGPTSRRETFAVSRSPMSKIVDRKPIFSKRPMGKVTQALNEGCTLRCVSERPFECDSQWRKLLALKPDHVSY